MENRFLGNKIVLNYCKDYYRIINEEFSSKRKYSITKPNTGTKDQ